MSIKSIGEAKADRILNLRKENGGTLTLHDLQKSKVVSNSVIKKLQHSGFILFSEKNVSADNKVSSSQEHLLVQVGTEDFHKVEEKDDEDLDDQCANCAFPDKESLHLSGLSTDHQKLQSPKVELSGSLNQVFPSQGTVGFEPETPVYLQAVVANFCHELPDKKLCQMWKRDSRIFHSHRIHLKFAHTASAQDFTDVRNAIIKDPRCVGIGEFGFDYSTHFSSYKTQQITFCRKFLQAVCQGGIVQQGLGHPLQRQEGQH